MSVLVAKKPPAEAESAFGDRFSIVGTNGSPWGSSILISNRITIRYIRPEDGYVLNSFYNYGANDEHGKAVILSSGFSCNRSASAEIIIFLERIELRYSAFAILISLQNPTILDKVFKIDYSMRN